MITTNVLLRAMIAYLAITQITAQYVAPVRADGTLRPELLGRPLSTLLSALGKRLVTPGMEMLQITGAVSYRGGESHAVTLTIQQPGKLRVDEGKGNINVIDQHGNKVSSAVDTDHIRLIESVLFDSQEYFLFDHVNFGGTRYIGGSFPFPNADPSSIYLLFEKEENLVPLEPGSVTKFFYFNQSTGLLEFVTYTEASGLQVQTQIQWQTIGTEQVPARITRLEGGQKVVELKLTSATTGPKGANSVFQP